MPHIPPKIDWKDSAVTGHPAKSSRFERDKFTGYLFAPFVDALTDDRRHIEMRGCRYTAPPLTSTGSVVYRTLRGYCNKFCKCTKGRRFHNHVGAFRRKADYTQMKRVNVPNEHRCKKNGGFLDAVCGVSACIFCKIACFIRSFAASSGLRLSQMAFQSCCISVTSDLFLECFSASLEERTHCGFFFLHHFCNFLAGILFIIIEI